jgi:hypothetical protein
MERISINTPFVLNLYSSLHSLYDETNDQEALGLLEAAENYAIKFEKLPFTWFIDGVKVLNNLSLVRRS